VGNLLSTRPISFRNESDAFAHSRDAAAWLRIFWTLERIAALFAAILIAPVAAVVALVIVLLSRQSPLVRHRRVGWQGRELRLIKFRTMWSRGVRSGPLVVIEDLPENSFVIKMKSDRRVTSRFAAWCRRYSLDEIPQLAHIIRGEMSFVGPRPITRAELDSYYGPCAAEILSLRPGLTGLWQIMGRNRLSYMQRRRLDVLLVRHASPRFFLAILIRTIPCVLGGHGAY
jgi:lipopolysaccharide/colanic/teichoic acid biosynthesis glycosyltransferase